MSDTKSDKPEPMPEEDQKFMALAGLRTWCAAAIRQTERIEEARKGMLANPPVAGAQGAFQADRHLFLISCWKVVEHIDWAKKLNFLDATRFDEFLKMREDIKVLRDLNEHVIEYFLAKGRYPENWWFETPEGKSDGSATVNTKIGLRLDWIRVRDAATKLLQVLPKSYLPARDGRPGELECH